LNLKVAISVDLDVFDGEENPFATFPALRLPSLEIVGS
jgi:hypothetical protein